MSRASEGSEVVKQSVTVKESDHAQVMLQFAETGVARDATWLERAVTTNPNGPTRTNDVVFDCTAAERSKAGQWSENHRLDELERWRCGARCRHRFRNPSKFEAFVAARLEYLFAGWAALFAGTSERRQRVQ